MNDQDEIGGRAGKGHPGGAARIALLPLGIVRGAGPADHPVSDEVGKDGNNNQADGFAANVRDWIERDLAAVEGGGIAAEMSDERMRAFVASGGEEKDDVPDESESEKLWIHCGDRLRWARKLCKVCRLET